MALQAKRPGMHQFKVDDFGAPPYPELVLCVSRQTLRDDRTLVAATVRALRRGYEETIDDPESAVEALVERAGVQRDATRRELDAVSPAFTEGATRYGAFDPAAAARRGRAGRRASASPSARRTSLARSPRASS